MKNAVTESLIATLKRSKKSKPTAKAIDFIRTYYHRLSGQDFESQKSQELQKIASFHQKLGSTRKPGQTIVALQNIKSKGHTSTEDQDQTIIYIILDDKPFVINSLKMKLNDLRKTPIRTLHPIFEVTRDKKHKALKYGKYRADDAGYDNNIRIESCIHFVIDYTPESEHQKIANELKKVLSDVDTVVSDWPAMRNRVLEDSSTLESIKKGPIFAEYGELFRWLSDDNFAFLGYCELNLKQSAKSPSFTLDRASLLGILRTAHADGANITKERLPPVMLSPTAPVVFTKTRSRANIHRSNYLDCIFFDRGFDSNTKKKTISCFLGFLAGSTAAQPTSTIPHLRKKTEYVLEASTLRKGGFAYKELRTILETLPRDKLFQMPVRELYPLCMSLLNQDKRKTRLHLHKNLCGHFYSCLVYVPRDLFNSKLRTKIQNFLGSELRANEVDFDVYFSDSILTRIHYIIHTDPDLKIKVDQAELERSVQEIAMDWNDNLHESIRLADGQDVANTKMGLFRDAFPPSYQYDFSANNAMSDTNIFLNLGDDGIRAVLGLANRPVAKPSQNNRVSFKLYCCGEAIALSDVLPILEHMGVRIHSGRPYRIETTNDNPFRLLDFELSRLDGKPFDLKHNGSNFESTFVNCWSGRIENDRYNQLTLLAGLSWRRINMIRAYYRYLKQIRLRYSENYIIEALIKNPNLVIVISNLFGAQFDPRRKRSGIRKFKTEIKQQLANVGTLDEERIIQALLDVIAATLRTNYFQPYENKSPKPYISFKLDSRTIPRIPEPIPLFEIFVYSPRIEGVHLRGGKVARGGLRWSERPEDFRTEVLGLVKAQRVKNAVIVPVGSKGGFVAKQLPNSGQDAILKEVIACYKIFISGLLDITDNLSGETIIPPTNVVRMDKDDPYLVVAADKGTATFSDIANGISEDFGFWLGDAFASGGSAGYDHKKMGITARGAWESVKRHFRELGKDIQSEPFTVIGIGDMSGDVFGNGMLLSKQIKLVAAFNHRQIFIDPNPNPATSYAERIRLFNLPRSSWSDYNTKLISKGGGIFSRNDKSIKLSAQAKAALGAKQDAYAPTDLINIILKAEVELLWNGGIGTYVKASSESHSDAQDRNNDSLRVNATELKCRVIGEGGNLGMTQLSRIEYCQHGGLCYTDAIDNSAGVDTSDHEVNIKILLNGEMQKNKLSLKQRNSVLSKMEKEVGLQVLINNYVQTQILSIDSTFSPELMPQQSRAIALLEQKGQLNRELEYLPGDAVLKERYESQKYLTRPELAVLLSYSKMNLYQELLDSQLPEDKFLEKEIELYFPKLLAKSYPKQIQQHRLKREIISTQITNNLVGTMGATFHLRLADLTGISADNITAAYIAARDIVENNSVTLKIQELDNKVDARLQMQCLNDTAKSLESAIVWLLRNLPQPIKVGATVQRFSAGYRELIQKSDKILAKHTDKHYHKDLSGLIQKGLPQSLAKNIAARAALTNGFDIVDIALKTKKPISFVAELYFGMSSKLGLEWLQRQINDLKVDNIWHERSKFSLGSDLRSHQSDITSRIVKSGSKQSPDKILESWQINNQSLITSMENMTRSLKQESNLDISMLSVLVSELSLFK